MSQMILSLLLEASLETFYMVAASTLIATLFGLPLGVVLYATRKGNMLSHPFCYQLLAAVINVTRSIPFIILMIAVIPMTRMMVGTSIGTNAAIVPLSLCAIPFVARVVENALLEVGFGLIEAATAMGATVNQIVIKVLIPEAMPGIINGLTLTIVNLVGYSAMAGAVGGGGLGDLAIRYGYQRFDVATMFATIVIIVLFVLVIQWLGDGIAKRFSHRN
jgi:D-methionine transport system permease protein